MIVKLASRAGHFAGFIGRPFLAHVGTAAVTGSHELGHVAGGIMATKHVIDIVKDRSAKKAAKELQKKLIIGASAAAGVGGLTIASLHARKDK